MSAFNLLFGQPRNKFNPKKLSGLVIWLKADAGITLNGSNVSDWADQSVNGNNLTQAGATKQPAFVASGINGKASVRGDGSNDVLASSGNVWPTTSLSLFAVLATRAGSTGEFFCDPGVGGDSRHHFYAGTETSIQRFSTGPTQTLTSQTGTIITYTATGTGAGSSESMYLNGGSVSTVANARPASANRILNIFGVGTTPLLPRSFDLSEFIIYDRVLGASELQKVHNYLRGRYGI